jgi:putative flippase GtrA
MQALLVIIRRWEHTVPNFITLFRLLLCLWGLHTFYWVVFVPSLIVGFLLHKYFTFRVHGEHWVWLQMSLYTIKRFVFIRINEYVLIRLVERHGFNTTVGQIVVAVAGFALNYLVTKLIFSI